MHTIEFDAVFGNQTSKVKLTQPSGSEGWQVIIDDYFNGTLFKRAGKWVAYLNNSDLTADDVQVLGERIDSYISAL